MYAEILERLELESALRTALDNEEYFLEYQPIVDLTAGRTTHVEALVRWEHPQRGCLTPTSFIPVAEAIGLIVPLGDWILAEACRQATRWQHPDRPVVMSVNLSPGQISADLPDRVAKILGSTGLSPFLLTLEITEGLLMDNDEERLDALRRLQQLGVRLAVDDFGTGYSSLSRLRDLPVDQLKIDRSFVRGITDVRSGAPLVGGVVAIARGLGLSVVAEGVETHEQRLMLRKLGCHLAQGYLFGRPVRADVMTESLRMAGPVGSTTFSPARAAVIPRARTAEEPVPLAQGG
jgi:EAL domain-containing protein (putative c-di-GMP-specific phosphodiesterase class I)